MSTKEVLSSFKLDARRTHYQEVEVKNMAKIWTLQLTLTVSTLFLHVPATGAVGFILNPDVVLNYNQYYWAVTQDLNVIILAAISWDESRTYKNLVFIYLMIVVADFVFFLLSYSDPLKSYKITWNILKSFLFLSAIGWHQFQKWRSLNIR